MPIRLLAKYFRQQGTRWRISDAVKRHVRFFVFNLLDSFEALGQFDIVFCRNVVFYFDQKTKQDVLRRFGSVLAGDGCLVLGAAETVLGLGKRFAYATGANGIYTKAQKRESLRATAMG